MVKHLINDLRETKKVDDFYLIESAIWIKTQIPMTYKVTGYIWEIKFLKMDENLKNLYLFWVYY